MRGVRAKAQQLMRRIPALSVLGLGAACGPGTVFVEAPDVEGARSFLFAIEQEGLLSVQAVAAGSTALGFGMGASISDNAELRLTRVAFAETLEELRLSEGLLRPSPSPSVPLGELSPLRTEVARVLPSSSEARFEVDELSAALSEFLLPSDFECPKEVVTRELTDLGGLADIVAPDETTAVALGSRALAVVRDDESVELLALPPGERGGAITLSDTGRVWVATSSAVRSFDPVTGAFAEPLFSRSFAQRPTGLHVLEASGEPEVWLMDAEARLLYAAPGSAEALEVYAVSPGRLRSDVVLFTVRFVPVPGDGFLAASREISVVLGHRRNAVPAYAEYLAEAGGRGYGGIIGLSDGSVLVSEMQLGEVWQYRERSWSSLGRRTSEIVSFAPVTDDRILFLNRAGAVGIMNLRGEDCPSRALATWQAPRSLVRLRSGYVFGGFTGRGGTGIGWLER